MYSKGEVATFIEEEDVKFIRLAFCDIYGRQKNISIMPNELDRAFNEGISFDASAIAGFGDEMRSDLFLHPDPSTLSILPWRPAHGRVVRMFCDIRYPDGTPYELDCRHILKETLKEAAAAGIECRFGSECEFYLFKTDEQGRKTNEPLDTAGYMDIAPEDKGENIRREICFTLSDMGIAPESSHHEEGPGQNEVDFRYGEPLKAADDAVTFKSVVKTIATLNGIYAEFSPKPLAGFSGNGMHINISLKSNDGLDHTEQFMAGILKHIKELTLFLNPSEQSYKRLGEHKAPKYITWSPENRSQLIRIPAAFGEHRRMELRSPDPEANPYLAYSLLIKAGIRGIKDELTPQKATNVNLFYANSSDTNGLEELPVTLREAKEAAKNSAFIKSCLPERLIEAF